MNKIDCRSKLSILMVLAVVAGLFNFTPANVQAQEIEVEISINMKEDQGKVQFYGKTNLPDGT